MRETIFLRVSRAKVEGMTKSMPGLHRGEIPVKLVIDVEASAFREPVIERHVTITDWREGVDIGDLELKEGVITEAEAQFIRENRLEEMRKILEEHGFRVLDDRPAATPQN
jgi:hypothetical protein